MPNAANTALAGARRHERRSAGAAAAVCLLGIVLVSGCGGDSGEAVQQQPARPAASARFTVTGDGIAVDSRTGLGWLSNDAAGDVTWEAAEAHCQSLTVGSTTGWRLPTIEELKQLYDETAEQPCLENRLCHIDPAIPLTSPYVWSATQTGKWRRSYMDFRLGTTLAPVLKPGLVRRVLCVRAMDS